MTTATRAPAGSWETDERRALARVAADFARREVVPHQEAWEAQGSIPEELPRRAARAGLLGVGFPEEVGGCGGDVVDSLVVSEAMIVAGAATGVMASLFSHGIALPALVRSGTPEQVDRWVRPALAGELVCSLAVTEPDAGSDVAGVRTRAVRDGDSWVVDGAKTYITSGVRADLVTVAVRTGGEGHGGLSLLVVERGTPGFEVVRPLAKMGWRASDTAELAFRGARVPLGNLVGAEGGGFLQIMLQFQEERLALAVQATSQAQRVLDLSLAWVRERTTFGKPLVARQVVRHKLARMVREVEVARTYVRSVAERVAAGEDCVLQVSIAKNQACAAADLCVDTAVQLHGGLGYMDGVEVERQYRDARILRIGGGTDEVMDEIIAKRLLGT